jgi:hypothetical protein
MSDSSLIAYRRDKEFLVNKKLGKLSVGTRVKIAGSLDEDKQEITLQIVDVESTPKKIPVKSSKEFAALVSSSPGSTHKFKISDVLGSLTRPTEQHGLNINLSAMRNVDFSERDVEEPHLIISPKTSQLKLGGFISMHTKELTGMVILNDTTRNGVPFCIGFVDFDTYEDIAFEMIDNTVEHKDLCDTLSRFSIDGRYTRYRTGEEDKVLGINLRSSFTIPEYEGVSFFRLRIPWYDIKTKTTSKQVRAMLQEIQAETDLNPADIISDY